VSLPPRERLEAAVHSSGAPKLITFLTAGYPARNKFREHLRALAAGSDAVEIGVPFTDPMADGVTIQRSSHEALKQGVNLQWILDELTAIAPLTTPLLLMSYLNPLLAYGYDRLAAASVRAGVCGFIVPDLPLDESAEMRAALDKHAIALVQMVTPVTTAERLARLCAASRGFVYAVTTTGTTGKNFAVSDELTQYLDRVRAASRVPVCAGFGIRSREQVQKLHGHVDGVVVASALIEMLDRGEDPQPWLAALRA
jgi:tryptophan synthase alpha chain